ncbi:MAG: CTP synthase, partial [Desulfobulbaceae bacterium]|nr:CTP synthase [Desulfobulbaceae bacterium]
VKSIYEVPLLLHEEGLDARILELLNIWTGAPRLDSWYELVRKIKAPAHSVVIGIIGKYVELAESYKSLHEAIVHGGFANDAQVELRYVSAEDIEKKGAAGLLKGCSGILVPGGFGKRGVEGKVRAITYARERKVPFLGICLGMQLAVIEFAKNVAGLDKAASEEFDENTTQPVIYLMREWYDYRTGELQIRDEKSEKGGSMRLGAYPCVILESTFAHAAYGSKEVFERHRHRFEFNLKFRDQLVKSGMIISGISPPKEGVSPDLELVEIVELADHPWFLGCQFHPEFKSGPMKPHPIFKNFVKASLKFAKSG